MKGKVDFEASVHSLRGRVLAALDGRGLIPSAEVLTRAVALARRRGERCREALLLPTVGRASWQVLSARLSLSDAKLAEILGFGEAITEFFVAGIPMSSVARSQVIRIGALAKFILSTYDKLVDDAGEANLLPRVALVQALKRRSTLRRNGVGSDASRQVIRRAVDKYVRLTYQLPFAEQRSEELEMVASAIIQLFDIEAGLRPNSRGRLALREETVLAKASLSFCSMGLPAWLASPRVDPRSIAWHRDWLYQVGEFLGWVDDLVDIEEDMALSCANRVVMRLRRPGGRSPRALSALAAEIAMLGSRVTDQWTQRVSMGDAHRKCLIGFKSNVCLWVRGRGDLCF